MLTKSDKKWVRETIMAIVEEYAHAEAKKYIEEQRARRTSRIEELEHALEVVSAGSPDRSKLEAKLVELLLGGSPSLDKPTPKAEPGAGLYI